MLLHVATGTIVEMFLVEFFLNFHSPTSNKTQNLKIGKNYKISAQYFKAQNYHVDLYV